jgi:mono/diheme cytochrome c family protein
MGMKATKWSKIILCAALALLSIDASAQLNRGPTRARVPMPDGPIRNVLLKNCVSCHGIDDYAYYALSRERWDSMLTELHKDWPVKVMSSADHDILLDYLDTTFGTESTPFPRRYIPPEIDTYYGDDQGRLVLETVCSECHALDRVYETRGSLERWRVLVLEMRARGAELPDDEELERMAEWLSRVQSANLFE